MRFHIDAGIAFEVGHDATPWLHYDRVIAHEAVYSSFVSSRQRPSLSACTSAVAFTRTRSPPIAAAVVVVVRFLPPSRLGAALGFFF